MTTYPPIERLDLVMAFFLILIVLAAAGIAGVILAEDASFAETLAATVTMTAIMAMIVAAVVLP